MSFLWPYKQKLEALLGLLTRIDTKTSWDDVLDDVIAFIGADRGTLYHVDPAEGELYSTICTGEDTLEIRLKIGKGLAGWVAMAGVPLVINDVLKDERFDARWDKKSGYHTHTVLGVPLRSTEGKIIGVVQLLNKPGGFEPLDVEVLKAVAHVISIGIELERRKSQG